ncbi:MAG: hypothetical protein ABII27_02350 [bacterium]
MVKNIINKVMDSQSRYVREVIRLADLKNIESFVVGGMVRDVLMGRKSLDLDFTFNQSPEDLVIKLSQKFNSAYVYHKRFNTYAITLKDGSEIDFATFRKEIYPYAGSLPVVYPGTLHEDLFRRDFTINAICMKLHKTLKGDLIDPFQGLSDLKRGIIRVLHCGSFIDDPTRIFRLVRFLVRFNFKMDVSTSIALEKAFGDGVVSNLSGARIKNELLALCKEKDPGASFKKLDSFGILKQLRPQLAYNPRMRFIKSDYGYKNLMILLQFWSIQEAHIFLDDLQLNNENKKRIIATLQIKQCVMNDELLSGINFSDVDLDVLPYFHGIKLNKVKLVKKRFQRKKIITGQDLRKMGFAPGPKYKEIILFVNRALDEGSIKSKKDAQKIILNKFSQ